MAGTPREYAGYWLPEEWPPASHSTSALPRPLPPPPAATLVPSQLSVAQLTAALDAFRARDRARVVEDAKRSSLVSTTTKATSSESTSPGPAALEPTVLKLTPQELRPAEIAPPEFPSPVLMATKDDSFSQPPSASDESCEAISSLALAVASEESKESVAADGENSTESDQTSLEQSRVSSHNVEAVDDVWRDVGAFNETMRSAEEPEDGNGSVTVGGDNDIESHDAEAGALEQTYVGGHADQHGHHSSDKTTKCASVPGAPQAPIPATEETQDTKSSDASNSTAEQARPSGENDTAELTEAEANRRQEALICEEIVRSGLGANSKSCNISKGGKNKKPGEANEDSEVQESPPDLVLLHDKKCHYLPAASIVSAVRRAKADYFGSQDAKEEAEAELKDLVKRGKILKAKRRKLANKDLPANDETVVSQAEAERKMALDRVTVEARITVAEREMEEGKKKLVDLEWYKLNAYYWFQKVESEHTAAVTEGLKKSTDLCDAAKKAAIHEGFRMLQDKVRVLARDFEIRGQAVNHASYTKLMDEYRLST